MPVAGGRATNSPERGRRYPHQPERGNRILLFVRRAHQTRPGVPAPYVFLGPVSLVSATGERPIAITWRLATPMPRAFFPQVKVVDS